MRTTFREDIKLEDHEHNFELADTSIKFKQIVSSEEIEAWYDENQK